MATFGLTEGMRVADFGCGSGYFAIQMAELVGESGLVTAIDVLDSALDTVRAKVKNAGLTNLETIRSNLEVVGSSGLADGSQDLVLLKNMLFQSTDRPSILREATRVLRAGGRLVVIDWKPGSGGLGPPEQYRLTATAVGELATAVGLVLMTGGEPDAFHFSCIFQKA